jgi:hypothetical protein
MNTGYTIKFENYNGGVVKEVRGEEINKVK